MILVKMYEFALVGVCLALSSLTVFQDAAHRMLALPCCIAIAGWVVFHAAQSTWTHVALLFFCAMVLFFIPMYVPWLAREMAARG